MAIFETLSSVKLMFCVSVLNLCELFKNSDKAFMLLSHLERTTAELNLVHVHALYHLCTADECYAQTGDSQLELHFFFSILLVRCYYNKIYLKKTECFGHFTLGRTLLFIRQDRLSTYGKRKGVQRANIESISRQ